PDLHAALAGRGKSRFLLQWRPCHPPHKTPARSIAPDAAGMSECRQELVFIGQHIDFAQLARELDACLLTDAEMAAGAEAWQALPDPFDPWVEVAA
ncbi:MAG: GTP-binding protein, partial [Halopseudomonas sp.]